MNAAYNSYIGILPDSNFATIQSDRISCPLGQLVIASFAKERVKGLDAVVYNGMRTSKKVILNRINDEVKAKKKVAVGITLTAGNTEDGFEIAEKAHKYGADVFIGGTETTMCGEDILEGREYIKAAIFGAGENRMAGILSGNRADCLAGTAWLSYDKEIQSSPIYKFGLDFENIKVDYNLLYDLKGHGGVSVLYGNDCQHVKKRCYFCGRQSFGTGFRDPDVFWNEVLGLYELGIATFNHTMDNIAVDMEKLGELAKTKPIQLRLDKHKTFINATDVNEESATYLKKINAIAAIGLENFALMEKVGKGKTKVLDHLRALQQLRDKRIPISLSMVLGIPGETKDTLEENTEWIDFIFKEYGEAIDQFLISPLIITTGSRAYHDLMALPKIRRKYKEKQIPLDTFEMSEDYFDNFCQVSRKETLEHILSINERIKKFNPRVTVSGHILNTEVQIKGIKR